MSRIEASIVINAPREAVFAFHNDPRNLTKVLPPHLRIEIVEAPEQLSQGALLQCVIHIGPLRFDWNNEITEHVAPHRFVDTQRKGPFRRYVHRHIFDPDAGTTRLTDIIEFELPWGPLAELASRVGFRSQLKAVLEHGQRATKNLLENRPSQTRHGSRVRTGEE
jgi:ligand-binding SRPBCC domain-containing protein